MYILFFTPDFRGVNVIVIVTNINLVCQYIV